MFASNTSQVANDAVFIEDTFACHLYTGNGSTQTITNGIDLAGKGGLVWTKCRSNAYSNYLIDTVQTKNKILVSNSTAAAITAYDSSYYGLTSFNSNGYSLGPDFTESLNTSGGKTFASWTFRKQPKFFDVVTYTGNGGTPQNISHSLGSVPGFIVVKPTSTTGGWICYHRSLTASGYNPAPYNTINLNSTGSIMEDTGAWNSTAPTSTVFTIGSSPSVNTNGATYVAYLFAHDAGGFGLTGTDNVISCGSAANGNSLVTLGYEPQWVLIKGSQGSSGVGDNWLIADAMRGMVYSGNTPYLAANLSSAEDFSGGGGSWIKPTATGFQLSNLSGTGPFIYIAIRRGPMKVPTSGTSVFSPYTATLSAGTTVNAGLTPDLLFAKYRAGTDNPRWVDRLRGFANATGGTNPELYSNETTAETTSTAWSYNWNNTGYVIGNALNGLNSVIYAIKRSPSFFDEVCYTASFPAPDYRAVANHNLTVTPELIIIKGRNITDDWYVYHSALGVNKYIRLNSTAAEVSSSNVFAVSSTTFSTNNVPVASTYNYVAYLFATCAGVSKVGSYTGTGATQTIACGFTGGARFVMIKRTDSTGDWYYWDTARGMVSGNDRYLFMNSNVGETNTNSIYTASGGFEIVSTAAGINASGGTYIFLAIA